MRLRIHTPAARPAVGYTLLLGALNTVFELLMFRGGGQPLDSFAAELAAGWAVAFLVGALLYHLFCRELQALRAAESERRASEARLADLLDGAGDAVVAVDEDLKVVLFNRVAEKTFGFTAEEILSQPLSRLLPSGAHEAHPRYISAFAGNAETQRPMAARREVTGRRKDGTEFPAEVSISKVKQDGKYTFTAIVRDVTERKRVEQQLRASEDRFRAVFEGAAIGIAIEDLERRLLDCNPALQRMLGYAPEELKGMGPDSHTYPADLTVDRAQFEELMSGARSHYQVEKRYLRKNGESLWGRLTLSLIRDAEDRPWFLVAMIEDVTRDKEAGAALERRVEERTREIERRRRVAEGLREIMAILNSGSSLDAVLQSVAEQAVGILQARAVSVFERQGDDLMLRAYTDRDAGPAEDLAFPLGKGPLGKAILERRIVALGDTRRILELAAGADLPPALVQALVKGIPRHRAGLAVPLVVKDELYGALTLSYPEPREFTEDEIELAGAFASQAALAIENARLRAQAGQVAAMEERSRLARDLHDSVTQSLYSLTLLAEATHRLAQQNDPRSRERVLTYGERLGLAAQQALKEMRSLVYALRPLSLDQQGLAAALRQRLEAVEARAGVETRLQVEGEVNLPGSVEEEVYRIALEALNNALKHAMAKCVDVTLTSRPGEFEMTVADDGIGFSPARAGEHAGLGLSTMRERANALAGRLQILSAPDQGTRVSLCLENLP